MSFLTVILAQAIFLLPSYSIEPEIFTTAKFGARNTNYEEISEKFSSLYSYGSSITHCEVSLITS